MVERFIELVQFVRGIDPILFASCERCGKVATGLIESAIIKIFCFRITALPRYGLCSDDAQA
jgi:hypothetical protein